MKDGFAELFGEVIGTLAGLAAMKFLAEKLNKKVTGKEDTAKKEESKFEEES